MDKDFISNTAKTAIDGWVSLIILAVAFGVFIGVGILTTIVLIFC